jgi:hypothetical protein
MAPDRRHLSTWPGSLGHDLIGPCFTLRSTGCVRGAVIQTVSSSANVRHSIINGLVMVPCRPVANTTTRTSTASAAARQRPTRRSSCHDRQESRGLLHTRKGTRTTQGRARRSR